MSRRFLIVQRMLLVFTVSVFSASAAVADTGDVDTLYRNYAAYLYALGQPNTALLVLKSRSIANGPLAAQLYTQTGLLQPAVRALQKWPDKKAATRAWLALAKAQYKTRKWRDAEHSLTQMPTFLPAEQDQLKTSLLARSLLRQNRNSKAARVLESARDRLTLTGVDNYNLGIAWLRAGEGARGASVLTELGRDQGDGAYSQALADQANLALGYWFLRHQRGGLARTAFERIHLHSPLADNAKVGIGWAELAAGGGLQRLDATNRGPCGAPQPGHWGQPGGLPTAPPRPCNNRPDQFGDGILTGQPARTTAKQAMRKAAVAWSSAAKAADLSPVVQEALIALPYALVQAGEPTRARTAYHNAITRLEPYIAQRAALISELKAGTVDSTDNAFTHASDGSLQPNEVTRLRQLQRQMARLRTSMQRNVTTASELAQPNTCTQTLATVLAQLRKHAPAGRKYAVPSAVQRGVLILALNANLAPAADSERLTTLINRLRGLAQRTQNLEERLASARHQRELKIINASYAFSQTRLREAYKGLADIAE